MKKLYERLKILILIEGNDVICGSPTNLGTDSSGMGTDWGYEDDFE